MAKMLLPPTPRNCPPYSKVYFESFRPQLFNACKGRRHRHCPVTSHQGSSHLYCSCPCHRKDLPRHKRDRLIKEVQEGVVAKAAKLLAKRMDSPKLVKGAKPERPAPKARGSSSKKFRYVKAPKDALPKGIMFIVHQSIADLKEGTIDDVTKAAIANGLVKATGQDPTTQTSIMLHRLLKQGVVELTT